MRCRDIDEVESAVPKACVNAIAVEGAADSPTLAMPESATIEGCNCKPFKDTPARKRLIRGTPACTAPTAADGRKRKEASLVVNAETVVVKLSFIGPCPVPALVGSAYEAGIARMRPTAASE